MREGDSIGNSLAPKIVPNLWPSNRISSKRTVARSRNQAIGRPNGAISSLPDLKLFLYSQVRKEAVLASQIEGAREQIASLRAFRFCETGSLYRAAVNARRFATVRVSSAAGAVAGI